MKILLYSLFGIAVFFVAVFALKPDSQTLEPIAESDLNADADVVHKEVAAKDTAPQQKGISETEPPVKGTRPERKRTREQGPSGEQQPRTTGTATVREPQPALDKEGMALVPPSESPFGDIEEMPSFPPLSPSEQEEFSPMPMDELPSGGFEAEGFGQGNQPFGGEGFGLGDQPPQELEFGGFEGSNPFQEEQQAR